jgi:hypothetical protein
VKFRRETATAEADLPHEFAETEQTPVCAICSQPSDEVRHLAWERQEVAERERASQALNREIGS